MIDKHLIQQAADDIDLFEADLTEEFEQLVKPRRTVRLWPLAAAACAALLLLVDPSKPPLKGEAYHAASSLEFSPFKGEPEGVWGWGESSLEAQLAHQQEIKEKGERLAAYVREYTTANKQ